MSNLMTDMFVIVEYGCATNKVYFKANKAPFKEVQYLHIPTSGVRYESGQVYKIHIILIICCRSSLITRLDYLR